jgi:hypothetical protein
VSDSVSRSPEPGSEVAKGSSTWVLRTSREVIMQYSEIKMVHVDAARDEPLALRLLHDEDPPLLEGWEEGANLTRPEASTQNVLIVWLGEEAGVPERAIVPIEAINDPAGPGWVKVGRRFGATPNPSIGPSSGVETWDGFPVRFPDDCKQVSRLIAATREKALREVKIEPRQLDDLATPHRL